MFQYSMAWGLAPVLSKKTASLLAANLQNMKKKEGTPLVMLSSRQTLSHACSQCISPNPIVSAYKIAKAPHASYGKALHSSRTPSEGRPINPSSNASLILPGSLIPVHSNITTSPTTPAYTPSNQHSTTVPSLIRVISLPTLAVVSPTCLPDLDTPVNSAPPVAFASLSAISPVHSPSTCLPLATPPLSTSLSSLPSSKHPSDPKAHKTTPSTALDPQPLSPARSQLIAAVSATPTILSQPAFPDTDKSEMLEHAVQSPKQTTSYPPALDQTISHLPTGESPNSLDRSTCRSLPDTSFITLPRLATCSMRPKSIPATISLEHSSDQPPLPPVSHHPPSLSPVAVSTLSPVKTLAATATTTALTSLATTTSASSLATTSAISAFSKNKTEGREVINTPLSTCLPVCPNFDIATIGSITIVDDTIESTKPQGDSDGALQFDKDCQAYYNDIQEYLQQANADETEVKKKKKKKKKKANLTSTPDNPILFYV
ncbi:hypothetical protein PCANC_15673 [Puccinia coronata f. sp. avenae]|nr:hypothetical protein PCANC_15673 [Puccinia coronata f. sp. avenae]